MKLLTLIHKFVSVRNYLKEDAQVLEKMIRTPLRIDTSEQWLKDFLCCYVTYLRRFPSIC